MGTEREVKILFDKLGSWRDVALREFSSIISSHSRSIKQGVNDLVKETDDLKAKLSVVTDERNNLLHMVQSMSGEIKYLREKLPNVPSLSNPEETNDSLTQYADIPEKESIQVKEEDTGITSYISKPCEPNMQINFGSCEYDIEQDLEKSATFNEHKDARRSINLDTGAQKEPINHEGISYLSVGYGSTLLPNEFDPSYESNFDELVVEAFGENIESVTRNAYEANLTHNGTTISKRQKVFVDPKSMIKKQEGDIKLNLLKSKDGYYKCEQCPYTTNHRNHMRRHIEGVHEHKRNHVCGECGYATSQKPSLKRHIESVHEKIKKHVCGECGYDFYQKRDLKKHIEGAHKKISDV